MMKRKLQVIKIGGETINSASKLEACLKQVANIDGDIILVHGGGRKVDELACRLGIEQKMNDGRRITTEDTLELCVMVYAGLINKDLVTSLAANGRAALGLSGADLAIIKSVKRSPQPVDFGFVGDIREVDHARLMQLLALKILPVFCSLTLSSNDELLNTNADSVAAEIAVAMSRHYDVKLIYCMEKEGVLRNIEDEKSVINILDESQIQGFTETKIINGGMLPKLNNAFNALKRGVSYAAIIRSGALASHINGERTGTTLAL